MYVPSVPEAPPFLVEEEEEEEGIYWRASVGLNFVVVHEYFGALVQEWFYSEREALDAIPRLKRELIRMVEDYVGYSINEWWFDSTVGEGVQEVYEYQNPYRHIERSS